MKFKIGSKINNLEILDFADKHGRYIQWKCKCKCGRILIVQNRYLKNTKNCGLCEKIRIDKSTFTGLNVINKIIKKK